MRLKGLEAKEYRRQIMINLQKKGMKQTEIAEITGVTQPYVSKVIRAYQEGGQEALRPSHAKGATSKITDKQLQELKDTLDEGADNHGYEDKIWNCGRVQNVIKEKFGVEYCRQHISRLLKKLNYTRQKPQLEDYRKNPEKVEEWKNEELPEIKKKQQQRNE